MNWIWKKEAETHDFIEFEQAFSYAGGKAELKISADYRYAAYINDRFVLSGQYADLPTYKCINSADLTPFVKKGENRLRVLAWHVGKDFFVCRAMTPSVAFEVTVDGKSAACSGKETRCRKAAGYRAGDNVTPQIGVGFDYDFTQAAGEWENAVEVRTDFTEVPRPIKQTTVGELTVPQIVAQGAYLYHGGSTSAEKMQNAWLSFTRFCEMTGDDRLKKASLKEPITFKTNEENIFVIADMGRETCGHLGFSVTVNKPCKMLLGWGEHLADLRVRTKIGPRNFGMEICLQAGENVFDDYLMRLGCRYLCIFVEANEATVSRLGIREVGYPFSFPKKDFGDKLLNQIYETGRRTLYLSAHEHYEDCPWREQALYGMDSRNQMLFGYGAFEEYEYQRANLMLMAKSLQEDNMLALCSPARISICIPSFGAYWLIAIGENAERDYNEAFVSEILPQAEKCLNEFLARESKDGILQLAGPAYWNFHEWSEGLDGGEIWRSKALDKPQGDCNLTALVALAAEKIAYLEERTGQTAKAEKYRTASARLKERLEAYYDEKQGAYASYLLDGEKSGYHAYTQSVVLTTGVVPTSRAKGLCEELKKENSFLIPATLAALQMKYQALIEQGELAYCMQDIVKVFGGMLFQGATSYWETENGEADFVDAGSLCHGWSSVACWVMDTYLK